MDFDKILVHLGEFKTYQKCVFFMLCFPPVVVALNMLSYVFNSAIPNHRCYIPNCDNENSSFTELWLNATIPYSGGDDANGSEFDSCKMYKPAAAANSSLCDLHPTGEVESCARWKYDTSLYELTVVSEWNLTCDDGWLAPLSGSIWMVGVLLGAALFGDLADRIGRRRALLFSCATLSVTSFVVPFCPNYVVFLLVRLLQATATSGVYNTTFVLAMELVSEKMRVLCGMCISIAFALGEVTLGGLAYHFRNWHHLSLALAIPTLFFLPYYWIVPESVRWLIARERYNKARTAIKRMAKVNKTSVPMELLDDVDTEDAKSQSFDSSDDGYSKKKYSVIDLFRRPKMRKRTCNILLNWFMNTIGYYGISMNATNLSKNAYTDFIIVSAIELPSYVFCLCVLNRYGRRRPLIFCMVFGGLACLSTAAVPDNPDLQYIIVMLSTIGKFGTAAAFATIYVYSAELFPTVLRNNGIGLSSFVAHIGGVLVPYIADLGHVHSSLPLLIYGASLFTSGVLAIFLPETLGEKLPETLEDAENFGMRRKTSESDKDESESLLRDTDSDNLVRRGTK